MRRGRSRTSTSSAGCPPGTISPEAIDVTVLNGTGVDGQAADAAGALARSASTSSTSTPTRPSRRRPDHGAATGLRAAEPAAGWPATSPAAPRSCTSTTLEPGEVVLVIGTDFTTIHDQPAPEGSPTTCARYHHRRRPPPRAGGVTPDHHDRCPHHHDHGDRLLHRRAPDRPALRVVPAGGMHQVMVAVLCYAGLRPSEAIMLRPRALRPQVAAGSTRSKSLVKTSTARSTLTATSMHGRSAVRCGGPTVDGWSTRCTGTTAIAVAGATSVSWHEPTPVVSLTLLDLLGVTAEQSVIDIGGGAVGAGRQPPQPRPLGCGRARSLQGRLDEARARLAEPASVTWIEHRPARLGAVSPGGRVARPGGAALPDERRGASRLGRGPPSSGHPRRGVRHRDLRRGRPDAALVVTVRRQSPSELIELLGDIEIVDQRRHVHHTPDDADQPFTWIAGRLR